MRFVAGQGAVAEQLPVGTVAELLTCRDTSADWQRRGREPSGSIWQGRRGRAADWPGHRGGAAAGSEVVQYHREENPGKDANKEEQLRDACRA